MRIISTSYSKTQDFADPLLWLEKIGFYTGILEELTKNNEVFSIERINYEGGYKMNGVDYRFLLQKKKTVLFPFRMHRLIRKLKPNVVLINGLIFPLQVIQLRWKLGRSVKIIVIHRSEKPYNGIKKYLQRWADKYINAYLFTAAEFGRQWVTNRNIRSEAKVYDVVHGSSCFHPKNKNTAKQELSIDSSPVFLWVGRLNANKDPLTVVKAFENFLYHEPLAKLYMIYQEDTLLEEIKKNIIGTSHIKLIGKIRHSELENWYNAADFIISGSHYEGGGISICEAMSCGCIPLLTNIISFRSITGYGKCGLLYEPGNPEDLLAVLLKTKEMNIEKEKTKVLQQFNDELSFPAIVQKIEKVIALLCKQE